MKPNCLTKSCFILVGQKNPKKEMQEQVDAKPLQDCRSMVCVGMKAGIDIWEAAVLSKLLFNSSCWLDISTTTIQELESIQLDFYRCLLAVGSGCPIPSLYWETGGYMMNRPPQIALSARLSGRHIVFKFQNTLKMAGTF